MKLTSFKSSKTAPDLSILSLTAANEVMSYHESFPMYQKTPLVEMAGTAHAWGVKGIYVKNEAPRFGLNAFKVLGGSYAIGSYIADRLKLPLSELTYEQLVSDELRSRLGSITFVTATDGNHGRGVAWTAAQIKQKSVVYMPKGSSLERLENIRREGADAFITEYNYDGCVRLAGLMAEKHGWVLIQDTAWDGYTDIPTRIIQGYATLALEAYLQLPVTPTHILVQAGVGSLAASVAGFFASAYGPNKPIIITVEPEAADCIFRSAEAGDGIRRIVEGDMDTIMAGLACGEPCSIGWEILQSYADYAISCSDETTRKGMRLLANPPGGDSAVISGESGAVGLGCVADILTDQQLRHIKEALGINRDSVILTFSTEGATDIKSYHNIVM